MASTTGQGAAKLQAQIGGGLEGCFEMRSHGDRPVYRALGEEEVQLPPTADDGAVFWRTFERLDVCQWAETRECSSKRRVVELGEPRPRALRRDVVLFALVPLKCLR